MMTYEDFLSHAHTRQDLVQSMVLTTKALTLQIGMLKHPDLLSSMTEKEKKIFGNLAIVLEKAKDLALTLPEASSSSSADRWEQYSEGKPLA